MRDWGFFVNLKNYLISGAFALFVVSLAATAYPGGQTRLLASEMSFSRGGSFQKQLAICNSLAGYAACTVVNKPCNTCGRSTYPFAAGAVVNSPVDPGNQNGGTCGDVWNGTCAELSGLECDTGAPGGGDTGNLCVTPPSIPPVEPE